MLLVSLSIILGEKTSMLLCCSVFVKFIYCVGPDVVVVQINCFTSSSTICFGGSSTGYAWFDIWRVAFVAWKPPSYG